MRSSPATLVAIAFLLIGVSALAAEHRFEIFKPFELEPGKSKQIEFTAPDGPGGRDVVLSVNNHRSR